MKRVTEKELLGRRRNVDAVLENIVHYNALNRVGHVDYNKHGTKDGIGFKAVTEEFIDNFLFQVPIADYHIQDRKYTEVGVVNKSIRSLLKRHGIKNFDIKATGIKPCEPSEKMKEEMLYRDRNKEVKKYYFQEYKIACPDAPYEKVMTFLRSKEYLNYGLHLKDIDVTTDYAGSFNRDEVVKSMVNSGGFRCQGEYAAGERTILDNTSSVGNNCLTYMEEVNGVTTRSKIYNKLVQALECVSVRGTIGNHLYDWVCEETTRLAKARDLAPARGLTRAEVTFYCGDDIPTNEFMRKVLSRITTHVRDDLVYSTPYHATWKAYCDALVHNLIVIDRRNDTALLVYSVNEVTGKVSGVSVRNWLAVEKKTMARMLLNLPIDVIEIQDTNERIMVKGKMEKLLTITGARYLRQGEAKTRIVKRGVHSYKRKSTKDRNSELLIKAGLLPNPVCVPYLAETHHTEMKNDLDVTYQFVEDLDVHLARTKIDIDKVKQHMEETLAPIKEEMQIKTVIDSRLDIYSGLFAKNKVSNLKSLPVGAYDVFAVKRGSSGETFTFILENAGEFQLYRCNETIKDFFKRLDMCFNDERNYYTDTFSPLCGMEVLGLGRNKYRNMTLCVNMKRKPDSDHTYAKKFCK